MKILSIALTVCVVFGGAWAHAEEPAPRPVLRIYGPSEPVSAMRELADRFEAKNNVRMEVTGGPAETWKAAATKEADVIFSASESMMDEYNKSLGILDEKTMQSFYLHPAALLVRPGNPSSVKGIKDVLKKNLKVMIVRDAGHVALWEDIVGQLKDPEALNVFRHRVAHTAPDSNAAEKYWRAHEEIDVWLTLNSWGKESPSNAEPVAIEKDLMLYRSLGAAVTTTTTERELSLKFLKFMASSQAEKIFKSHGWFRKEGEELRLH